MPRPVKTATAREEDVMLRGSQRRQLRERERDEKTLLFIGSQNVLIDLATFKFHYRQLLVNKLTIAGWLSVCFCVKVSQASHHPWLHNIFPGKWNNNYVVWWQLFMGEQFAYWLESSHRI